MGVMTQKPNSSDAVLEIEVDGIRLSATGSVGSKVTQIREFQPTLDPVSVAANTTAEQTLAVVGLATADKIIAISPAAAEAGLGIVGARVSAPDTLAITFTNPTAAPIDPISQVYTILALRTG